MMHPTAQCLRRRLLSLSLALVFCAGLLSGSLQAQPSVINAATRTGGVRVIVQLVDPSVASAGYGNVAAVASGDALYSMWPTAAAYRQHLESEQRALAARLLATCPGAVIEQQYQVALNGMAVRLPDANARTRATLEALPGVRTVYDDVAYNPTLYASLDDIKVSGLWNAVGGAGQAGAGVKIAVLDSGIQTDHPMLNAYGLSYPAGYPKGDGRDASPKVIVARIYVRPDDAPLGGEDRPAPGKLGSAHGTHVAGVAAGASVSASYLGVEQQISGVAPRAWLMNYRIFYPAVSGREVAYEAEILRAVEDAVLDGADVLCASWSSVSARAPEASPLGQALAGAVDMGCVVVASAGDAGPGFGSVSQVPGAVEAAITVGAVSKSSEIVAHLADVVAPQPVPADIVAQRYAPALFGGTWQGVLGPYSVVDVRQADPTGSALACGSLSSDVLTGGIAVIARGGCAFADKAYHAQQAGAVAVMIVNDSDELVPMSCDGAYCGSGVITIPVVMVAQSFGQRLTNWAATHPDARLRLDADGRLLATPGGVVEAYSGRGPAHLRSLKPDLVAPGRGVLSAWFEASGQPSYAQQSGSSMAAAHVAGSAALLMQQHPTWTPAEIKSTLMTTASPDGLTVQGSANPAGVLDRGAGVVNLSTAAASSLLITPPSLALGQINAGSAYAATLSLKDTRTSGVPVTYNVLPTSQTGLSIMPALSTITVAPGQRVSLNVALYVDPGTPTSELTGELYFVHGADRQHVPIWAHDLPGAATAEVLLIDNDFSFYGGYRDYSPYITQALDALGVTYRVWDADVRYDQAQTLPAVGYLQGFDAVIWLTGDNRRADGYYVVPTPLTALDQAVLQAYLDGGGRLLAIGQNLAEASDINPSADSTWGRSALLHSYLGAHWIQGSLFDPAEQGYYPPSERPSVVGWPGGPFAEMQLDLGAVGDGASDQLSVDEIAPGGVPDGSDSDLVQPLFLATEGFALSGGCVAVGKQGDPSLERRTQAIPYRSLYFSFGLEGVNNNLGSTKRTELLRRSLDWLLDEVSVQLESSVVAVNNATAIDCSAQALPGYPVNQYRWAVTDDAGSRTVTTSTPSVTLLYAQPGTYALAVEATDLLGHRAVAQTDVVASYLGASTFVVTPSAVARLGDLVFRITLHNNSAAGLSAAFSMPLPDGAEYVSHSVGTYSGNVYRWAGTMPGESNLVLQLRVRAKASTPSGSAIRGVGTFTASGVAFSREAQALVHVPLYLPLVER